MTFLVRVGEQQLTVQVDRTTSGTPRIVVEGEEFAADIRGFGTGAVSLLAGTQVGTLYLDRDPALPERREVFWAGHTVTVQVADARHRPSTARSAIAGRRRVLAPMAGCVVRLLTEPGQKVAQGQTLLVLEAMKMQNEVRSPKAGYLAALPVRAGAIVAGGDLLAEIE